MSKKRTLFFTLLILVVTVGIYHNNKSLPDGISLAGETYQVASEDVHFLQDVTFVDSDDNRESEQEIFDEVFRMIDEAQAYILIDLFFYSDFTGVETSSYRELSEELTQKLIDKKTENPDITIQVITDPINVMYGGHVSEDFERLRAAGISVAVTELTPLRDSNPLYSSFWRTFFRWFGVSAKGGWLPNPLDAKSPDLGLRTYLKMLNYKANHRKVVLTDFERDGQTGFSTLITSANPHDGSSAHSNIAIRTDSHVWRDILTSEAAVMKFSGTEFIPPPSELIERVAETSTGTIAAQILTEQKIEARILAELADTEPGDTVDIAMFYFADREIIKALKDADARGVKLRLLLDPNKDAFGREKNGTPNRQVSHELIDHSSGNTTVRWCDTHGEQCHSKLLLITRGSSTTLIQGSANYTKRNLDDYNLETNILLQGDSSETVFVDTRNFFETQWNNEEDRFYSTEYETFSEDKPFKVFVYRFKEFTGLSRW